EVASSDFVGLVGDCLFEDTVYRGLVSILEEAVEEAKQPEARRFAAFNLARIHVARAGTTSDAVRRRAPLAAAAKALAAGDGRSREVAWIDLQGEIESLRGNVAEAIALFDRLTPITGNPAIAAARCGEALRRAGRLDEAASVVGKGLRNDREGRRWRHRLYQVLGSIELDRGRIAEAEVCLQRSAEVAQDTANPWPFQMGLAMALLGKGRRMAVRAYAEAALKHLPEDPDARRLANKAEGPNR
ncbi:MAG: hypothetical protein ACKO5K_08385, partial [Armatimonadota bacterium]